MKVCLVLLGLLAYTQAQTTTEKPNCTGPSDCAKGECCVHADLREKRFIFHDLFGGHKGDCQPYRQMGESCHAVEIHDVMNKDMYEWSCPCVTGLVCRGATVEQVGDSVVHHNPKCQNPSSPAPQ